MMLLIDLSYSEINKILKKKTTTNNLRTKFIRKINILEFNRLKEAIKEE